MSLKSATPAAMLVTALMIAAPVYADQASAGADARVEADTGFWGRLFGGGKEAEEQQREAAQAQAESEREMRKDEAKYEREYQKAQAEREKEYRKAQAEREREYHKAQAERAREADKAQAEHGHKKGWVDGMPPGQARKEGMAKAKPGKGAAEHGDADTGEETTAAPMTADEALRSIAKDKAVRASGAAKGSAEEALIEIGTDIAIDQAQTY